MLGKLFSIILLCAGSAIANDPCEPSVYDILPRANYRGGQCMYQRDKPVCDRNLIPNWYRAQHDGTDFLIQTSSPDQLMCGTSFQYWMNGTLPDVADAEVTRAVCQSNLPDICKKTHDIRVKNCDGFFVYELNSLDSCNEAYCFGEEDECPPYATHPLIRNCKHFLESWSIICAGEEHPCDIFEHTKITFDRDNSGSECSSATCTGFGQDGWLAFEGSSPLSCFNSSSDCYTGDSMFITDSSTASNGTIVHTICHTNGSGDCFTLLYASEKRCSGGFSVYRLPDLNIIDSNMFCVDNGESTWYTCQHKDEQTTSTDATDNSAGVCCHGSILMAMAAFFGQLFCII